MQVELRGGESRPLRLFIPIFVSKTTTNRCNNYSKIRYLLLDKCCKRRYLRENADLGLNSKFTTLSH